MDLAFETEPCGGLCSAGGELRLREQDLYVVVEKRCLTEYINLDTAFFQMFDRDCDVDGSHPTFE